MADRWRIEVSTLTGADAEDLQAGIEEPVEKALQLRLIGERSAQLCVPRVTAKR
jgi:hypothetical protein